jgi:hypothetical protein
MEYWPNSRRTGKFVSSAGFNKCDGFTPAGAVSYVNEAWNREKILILVLLIALLLVHRGMFYGAG